MLDSSPLLVAAIAAAVAFCVFLWWAAGKLPRAGRWIVRPAILLILPVVAMMAVPEFSAPRMARAPAPPPAEMAPVPSTEVGRTAESSRRSAEPEAPVAHAPSAPPLGGAGPPPGSSGDKSLDQPGTGKLPEIDNQVVTQRKRAAAPKANGEGGEAWDVVPVYYGTDRGRENKPDRAAYGADRAGRLELGRALVTVPKVHQVPQIERPWVYKIPFTQIVIYAEREDPKLHFTLQEVKSLSREEFLALVRARLEASREFKNHALVFIHGFNTAFDSALYRTAQIANDLKFDGAPFVYSWPSQGGISLQDYTYDRESAEGAQPHLRAFLELVAKESGATSVSLIAHSMGNQALLPVLRDLKNSTPPTVSISEIILAAPDVSRQTFENMTREIRGLSRGGVTLYASANDKALLASRNFWRGARAGEVPEGGPLVVDGVDTIDVSSLSTEFFGLNHSGYAETTKLLSDIGRLIRDGLRPPTDREPSLEKVPAGERAYWRYP